MAEVPQCPGSSPTYVVKREDGGDQQKAGEENTSPFKWMIEGFSTLRTRGAAKYHSGKFTAGGFTWKLQVEANTTEADGEKSVLLYLLYHVHPSSSTAPVVKATYRLFIYDQLFRQHVQTEGEDYFHSNSHRGSSSCKVLLKKFNDPKSGLVVNDSCIFGADIREAFACKLKQGVSERWSINKETAPVVEYSWVIKDFLKLNQSQASETFIAGEYIWRMNLNPNVEPAKGYLGIFLRLDNLPALSSKTRVFVEFALSVLNQIDGKDRKHTGFKAALFSYHQFSSEESSWGWRKFLEWEDVQDPSKGIVRDGTCIIRASVTFLGTVTVP